MEKEEAVTIDDNANEEIKISKYSYDKANRLIEVKKGNLLNESGTYTANYIHNEDGSIKSEKQ